MQLPHSRERQVRIVKILASSAILLFVASLVLKMATADSKGVGLAATLFLMCFGLPALALLRLLWRRTPAQEHADWLARRHSRELELERLAEQPAQRDLPSIMDRQSQARW